MQCVAPYRREFFLDFVDELRRLSDRGKVTPFFPEPAWFRALRAADAKDRFRTVAKLNGLNDGSYFEHQSTCKLPGDRDPRDIIRDRTTAKFPQIDSCPAPRFNENRGTGAKPKLSRATKWEFTEARNFAREVHEAKLLERDARAVSHAPR